MILRLHLHVKFRAFYITFTEIDRIFELPYPGVIPGILLGKKLYNDRGVLLEILMPETAANGKL